MAHEESHPRLDEKVAAECEALLDEAEAALRGSKHTLMRACATAVTGQPVVDWPWLLRDLRERRIEKQKEDPGELLKLMQYAEAYFAAKGKIDPDVPISVYIEGRNLPKYTNKPLHVTVEEMKSEGKATVSRMKAYMTKFTPRGGKIDLRQVDEIEAAQKTRRREDSRSGRRTKEAEEIANTSPDPAEGQKLLKRLTESANAYNTALVRLRAYDIDLDRGQVAIAATSAETLLQTLKSLAPPVAVAV